MLNGCVVTESESDDPQLIANLDSFCESGRLLISKRRKSNQRLRHLRAKTIAEQRFLSKRTSKRMGKILAECSNIKRLLKIMWLSTILSTMLVPMHGAVQACLPLTVILVSHKKSPMNVSAFTCRRYIRISFRMEQ